MTDAETAGGGLAASATNADLDMSGVDPLRYAEMRRRIAVIREFIATERKPKTVREAFAARLGVGEKQFMRLVSTWCALGDDARAAQLDGATSGKGGRRPRRGGLKPETRAVVADVINNLGSDASLAAMLEAVRHLAASRGVAPPARSSIWNMLMEARSQGAPSHQEPGVVTGVVFARIPVVIASDDNLTLDAIHPAIALAVRSPDGAILAYDVGMGAINADARRLVLRPTFGEGPEDADADVGDDDEHRLPALLGGRIAGIRILHRPSLASPAASLVRSRRDAPISPDDAHRLIAVAIAEHNEARAGSAVDVGDTDISDRAGQRAQIRS